MKTLCAFVFTASFAFGAVSVPLTIQERLYPGDQTGHVDHVYNVSGGGGIARSNEPFCVGVPLADSANITSTSALGLTGSSAGQFRVLAVWPSGNYKWVEVCGLASMSADSTATITLTDSGNGNFPAGNLASGTDPITVGTGAATFTIKGANHNGLDTVSVGATPVVSTGTSQGYVIKGPDGAAPYPANVTCLPDSGGTACTFAYSSANDAGSTCSIEKNGPVEAVVKCTWTFKDAGGRSYMNGTARYYFHRNQTSVRVTTILRNADLGASNTITTAFKGHQGLELHTGVNLGGTGTYNFGCETGSTGCATGTVSGTMSGTDSIYLYQAQAHWMHPTDWCTGQSVCIPYTTDTGYRLVKTVSGTPATLASDTTLYANNGVNIGWADIANASGVGVEIGVPDMPGVEMKSLEFRSGGTDAVIGLLAPENSQPWYQAYPQHEIFETVLNFHATAPASLTNAFRALQAPLVARADYAHYNSTKVFPYTMVSPTEEDAWYTTTATSANPAQSAGSACCTRESGPLGGFVNSHPWQPWRAGGGNNQTEFGWSYLLNFITRGFSGRYLDSMYFYRLMASHGWPSTDFAGGWRGTTHRSKVNWVCNNSNSACWNDSLTYGSTADTQLISANFTKASLNWQSSGGEGQLMEHFHWYGMTDYYMMSGDETIRDAIMQNLDWFIAPAGTIQGNGLIYTNRSSGVFLMGASRLYTFLKSIGDSSNAAAVLAVADNVWNTAYAPDQCMSGYPLSGGLPCTVDFVNPPPPIYGVGGINRKRGTFFNGGGSLEVGNWCTSNDSTREANSFMMGGLAMVGGMEYLNAKYSDHTSAAYLNNFDLLYGLARALTTEFYYSDASTRWDTNGWYYKIAYDLQNGCNITGDFSVVSAQTIHLGMLPLWQTDGGATPTNDWKNKLTRNWNRLISVFGVNLAADYGAYQTAHMISIMNNMGSSSLQSLTPTVQESSGCAAGQPAGYYCVTWTTPANTSLLRVKYSNLQIVDWIGFNILTNSFTGNPATTTAWFAAPNATGIPAPSTGTQSMVINAGTTGLVAQNFSVKALTTSTPANTITWHKLNVSPLPNYLVYNKMRYDPLSQGTIMYQGDNGISIYSNSIWHFKSGAKTIQKLWTSGTTGQICNADTATVPTDRHAIAQMAIDTKRHVMWQSGGVCNGQRSDLYKLSLNANPTPGNTGWTKVTAAHYPLYPMDHTLIYDPDTDALIEYGYDGGNAGRTWIYCPTDLNPVPGTLTAAQSSAGCNLNGADDWSEVRTTGGEPPYSFPDAVYDTRNRKVILVGGKYTSDPVQTWTYSVSTKTWTRVAAGTGPPTPPSTPDDTMHNSPAIAYNSGNGLLYVHAGDNVSTTSDWTFDPATNKWTNLGSLGGPIKFETIAYDASTNKLVATASVGYSYTMEVWVGDLDGVTISPTINTASLPNGTVGIPYSQTLTATGDAPITWDFASGNFAACGLTLASNGWMTGTPTTATSCTATVRATNGSGNDSRSLTLTIDAGMSTFMRKRTGAQTRRAGKF